MGKKENKFTTARVETDGVHGRGGGGGDPNDASFRPVGSSTGFQAHPGANRVHPNVTGNRRKVFNPNSGQILALHGDAEAVFVWTGFHDPIHIEKVLTAIREYCRNTCTGVFITGLTKVEPLPRPKDIDTDVEDFASHRASEGNLDLRTSAAIAISKLNA